MSTDFERLQTEGFALEGYSVRGPTLRASYGDGYAEGAVIGHPDGLITLKIKISALPDFDEYQVNAGEFGMQTRWQYLFDFYVRHNVNQAWKPFWMRDPKSRRDYLFEIAEEQLDMQMFSLKVSTVGLTLRQRRVHGQESPSDPVEVENNAEI
jgi:hypothetical protein